LTGKTFYVGILTTLKGLKMVFENYYLKILAVDMGVQWVAWGVSAALKTERFYDLTGNLLNLFT
jgi:hypothetical protein